MAKIGIYALLFPDNSVYIGQSVNIEKRQATHLRTLKNNSHHNKQVQSKFNNFNTYEFLVLEECGEELLNEKEIEYCNLINKENLLNLAEPGVPVNAFPGESNGRSKYSNDEVVSILFALSNTDISKKELASKSIISYSMIRQIASGTAHTWLKDLYPIEYSKMLGKVKQKITFTVKSPSGEIFTSSSQRGFANTHRLCSTMFNQLINKKRKELLGWTLLNVQEAQN